MQNAYSRRMSSSPLQANLYALGAIALWASLASLGVSLTHIPPFLLTGITLIIGSVPAWPFVLRDPSQWSLVRLVAADLDGDGIEEIVAAYESVPGDGDQEPQRAIDAIAVAGPR